MERLSVPAEGLGPLLLGGSNPLIEHARPALRALDEWLPRGGPPAAEISRLIGLGPGLTPSGDDYLGGVLLALRAFHENEKAELLWNWLAPRLIEGTSALSAAHLAAAASGRGSNALLQCIDLLFEEKPDAARRLRALGAVGHCSGWDSLAGAASVAANAAARALEGATSTPASRRIAAWRDHLCGSSSVPVTEATTGF